MNTLRVPRQRRASPAIPESSAAAPATPVTVESSYRPDTHQEVANQDALVETRPQIVNPLWMVTGGLAVLLALLAIFSATG